MPQMLRQVGPTPRVKVMPSEEYLGQVGGFKIFAVDDEEVKIAYDIGFTEGGNGRAYYFVKPDHILLSKRIPPGHRIFIFFHEAPEFLGMSPTMDYDTAHEWANALEYCFRVYVYFLLHELSARIGPEGTPSDPRGIEAVIEDCMAIAEHRAFTMRPHDVDPEVTPVLAGPAPDPQQAIGKAMIAVVRLAVMKAAQSNTEQGRALRMVMKEWKKGVQIGTISHRKNGWWKKVSNVPNHGWEKIAPADHPGPHLDPNSPHYDPNATVIEDPYFKNKNAQKPEGEQPSEEYEPKPEKTNQQKMQTVFSLPMTDYEKLKSKLPEGVNAGTPVEMYDYLVEHGLMSEDGELSAKAKQKPKAAAYKPGDEEKAAIINAMSDEKTKNLVDAMAALEPENADMYSQLSPEELYDNAVTLGVMDEKGNLTGKEPGLPAEEPLTDINVKKLSPHQKALLKDAIKQHIKDFEPQEAGNAQLVDQATIAELQEYAESYSINLKDLKEQEDAPATHGIDESVMAEFTKPKKLPTIESQSDLGGTTGAKKITFQHELGGTYTGVMKTGASEAHAVEEHQANLLYAVCGVHVPASHLYEHDGKKVVVTSFMEGAKSYAQCSGIERDMVKQQLKKNFAVDALLGNWDVTGADFDNVLYDPAGSTAYRIDNGGSLRFRAQGASKGSAFGSEVPELETMRDKAKLAGKLAFGDLTDNEVKEQIGQLYGQKEMILQAVHDPALKQTIAQRLEYMKGWAKGQKEKPQAEHNFGKVVEPAGKKSMVLKLELPEIRKKERDAVDAYQADSGVVNKPLRGYGQPTANQKAVMDALDSYIGKMPEWDIESVAKAPLYRGVGRTFVGNYFKGLGLPKFSFTTDQWDEKTPAGKLTWGEVLTKMMVGTTFMDQGYFGTSTSHDKAKGFMSSTGGPITHEGASCLFRVKGKAKAVPLYDVGNGNFAHEREHLFPRGQGFRIMGVEPGPGYLILDVQVAEDLSV